MNFKAAHSLACFGCRDGDWPHGVCWSLLCEETEVVDVPGDHFSILRQVNKSHKKECKGTERSVRHDCSNHHAHQTGANTLHPYSCSHTTQGKEDMALLVSALKKALGAFGWTESVRREPRNLLLQVSECEMNLCTCQECVLLN